MSTSAFPFETHAELLAEAGGALRAPDLTHVHRYPTRYDRMALPYEPVNLWRSFRSDGPRLFDRTAVPGLYRRILARRSPALADLTELVVNQVPGRREQWERLFGDSIVGRLVEAGALAP